MYTDTKSSAGTPNRLSRLNIYSLRLLLVTMLLIWDCQPRSDWTTRPRSLVSDTSSRSIPAIWRLGGLGGSRLKQTCMTLHFPGLSMRWLSLAQASRSCTSELIWLGLSAERVSTSVRSSTKKNVELSQPETLNFELWTLNQKLWTLNFLNQKPKGEQ